jgi:hypothetical protein
VFTVEEVTVGDAWRRRTPRRTPSTSVSTPPTRPVHRPRPRARPVRRHRPRRTSSRWASPSASTRTTTSSWSPTPTAEPAASSSPRRGGRLLHRHADQRPDPGRRLRRPLPRGRPHHRRGDGSYVIGTDGERGDRLPVDGGPVTVPAPTGSTTRSTGWPWASSPPPTTRPRSRRAGSSSRSTRAPATPSPTPTPSRRLSGRPDLALPRHGRGRRLDLRHRHPDPHRRPRQRRHHHLRAGADRRGGRLHHRPRGAVALSVGQSAEVEVTFAPTAPGRPDAALEVTHDGDGGSLTVPLIAAATDSSPTRRCLPPERGQRDRTRHRRWARVGARPGLPRRRPDGSTYNVPPRPRSRGPTPTRSTPPSATATRSPTRCPSRTASTPSGSTSPSSTTASRRSERRRRSSRASASSAPGRG